MKSKQAQCALESLTLDSAQAAQLIGISRSTFWKLYSQGKTPEPLRIGDRVVRWVRAEIEAWILAGCPSREKWNFSA